MISYIIIVITTVLSVLAFRNKLIFDGLKFNAYFIKNSNEWYRFFSYGLIHADWMHLIINMMVMYSFGSIVEKYFSYYLDSKSIYFFAFFYVSALAISVLFSYKKHNNEIFYNAVGASGAVSAIVFSSIILHPQGRIMLMFLPIPIPSPIFGILYLVFSYIMAKKSTSNIGHDAHFWGAIYGIVYTLVAIPNSYKEFLKTIYSYFN